MNKFGRNMIVIIALVVVSLVWIGLTFNDGEQQHYSPGPSNIKLSSLSDNLQKSLDTLEKRAQQKQKNLDNRLFKLNFLKRLGKDVITSSTPLVLQTYYKDQKEEEVTSMPASFVGLTVDQLSSVLEDWKVKEYSQDKRLVIYRNKLKLSPEIKKYQHLGIKDGKVVIFYGKKGDQFVKQITEIEVEDLPERERKTLEKGIVIESEEELMTILEGLVSINQD